MAIAKKTRVARRRPKQARAVATRDLIFEATAQILERDGEQALNTNRIAERAGLSVGTIYQYFPDKTSILVAMAQVEQARNAAENARIAARGGSHKEMLRLSMRRLIRTLDGRPATRRAVVKAVMAHFGADALGREIDRTAYLLPAQQGMSRLDAFVLTRAVVGVVRAAVLEGYAGLTKPEFEDALMRLVSGYQRDLAMKR
jgi:AcrR family transcriptional regulator